MFNHVTMPVWCTSCGIRNDLSEAFLRHRPSFFLCRECGAATAIVARELAPPSWVKRPGGRRGRVAPDAGREGRTEVHPGR